MKGCENIEFWQIGRSDAAMPLWPFQAVSTVDDLALLEIKFIWRLPDLVPAFNRRLKRGGGRLWSAQGFLHLFGGNNSYMQADTVVWRQHVWSVKLYNPGAIYQEVLRCQEDN